MEGNLEKNKIKLSKINLLAVDDDPDFLDFYNFFLKICDPRYVIHTFLSSQEAIEFILLQNPQVDFIISDYNMDFCDGFCFFKQIKKLGLNIPFILCSSFLTEALVNFAYELGISKVVQKGTKAFFEEIHEFIKTITNSQKFRHD